MRSLSIDGPMRWCALSATLAAIITMSTSAFGKNTDDRIQMIATARQSVPSNTEDQTLSPYFFVWGEEDQTDALPLKCSSALVDITGVIADVHLEQVYKNNGSTTLEAIYIFPTSSKAAVYGMKMTVGDRVVHAKIKKRKEARDIYEKAKQTGKTASLLEQQRPNVFEMNVANILPGDEILVELSYTELLVPEESLYEFVFPTVIGPRYSNTLEDQAADNEKWVANPYLHEGEGRQFDFDVDLSINAGMSISKIFSPTHAVKIDYESETEASITLNDTSESANRDYILRYSLAGKNIQSGLLTYDAGDEKFFLMMAQPPKRVAPETVVPREYVFIVDVSGSMNGFPLTVSKRLISHILLGLNDEDYFNVMLFAGGSAVYSKESVKATPRAVSDAKNWIERTQGGGGTELLPALERALALPRHEGTSRIVVLATDGYVTVEKKAYELIRQNLSKTNFFPFGIGSSVNRFLIEGLARAGMGEPFIAIDEVEAEEKAERFERYVSSPVLQNVKIKMDGFDAYDVEPLNVPDLFASRPIVLFGKYKGKATGKITIEGNSAKGPWKTKVDVVESRPSANNKALMHLWARHKIARLADLNSLEPSNKRVKQVTKLGLDYSLMTDYTSFVAVDEVVRANGKKKRTVRQPLALPEGVSDSAVGNLNGSAIGSNFGYGGLGLRGTGRGGGGTGGGTIGLGKLSVIGHGGGGGTGTGYGRGSGTLAGRRGRSPVIRSGAATVKGSLSKDVIKRAIHRQINVFRFCYERALQANPNLEGKVVIKLVVKGDGTVQAAAVASSTLNNAKVEQCIVKAFKRLSFPKVPGGGVVVIHYPLIFKKGS